MLVLPEERRPLAHLIRFFEQAEQLAHDCAAVQAVVAPTPRMSRFLQGQARQEAFHARLFHGAAVWIAPPRQITVKPLEPLMEYRALLRRALARKDFLETILAEQVILESLGEATLHKLEGGLKKRRAPFRRLRGLLLHQEEAHHRFGERVLEQAIANGSTSYDALRIKAVPFLALSESIITTMKNQLEDINEDPQTYIHAHRKTLPSWLIDGTEDRLIPGNTGDTSFQFLEPGLAGEPIYV